jgi:hypothetical protein
MSNPKMESRKIKKITKSIPKHYVFFCYCCALKYLAAANFLIGSSESFENGRGFWRMRP